MKNLFTNENRKYCKLTSDEMFYAVYGADTEDSNRALIALINTVLDRKNDPIVKIAIKNPIYKDGRKKTKDSVLDVRATANSGEIIDVEMQNEPEEFYPNRSVYYGGKLIITSLKKGEKYDKMKKSIVISFVNGIMFQDISKCHAVFRPREDVEGTIMSDRIEWHYIQLGRVSDKKEPSDMDPVERLAAYLKYAHIEEKNDYLKKLIDTTEVVSVTETVFGKMTEEEIAYELREDQERYEHQMASILGVMEDRVTAKVTDKITAEVTDKVTAEVTDKVTAEVTDKVTAEVTDKVTAEVTDKVTAEITDKVTAEVTDKVTAEVTDKVTAEVTDKVTAEVVGKTETRLNQLVSKLLTAKRYEDLERSTQDEDFRQQLYKEYEL